MDYQIQVNAADTHIIKQRSISQFCNIPDPDVYSSERDAHLWDSSFNDEKGNHGIWPLDRGGHYTMVYFHLVEYFSL